MRRDPPLPTEAELRLLRVLWERGPSSVRAVHGRLPRPYAMVVYLPEAGSGGGEPARLTANLTTRMAAIP